MGAREGPAGPLLLAAAGGTGGAGGFRAGSEQRQAAALGPQSPPRAKSEASRAGHPAGVPEPSRVKSATLADGFSLVGTFSSSSNVTQPLGCTFSTLREPLRRQEAFAAAPTGNRGLPGPQLGGGRTGNGWEAAAPASTCEGILDSPVSILNGFPALGVLSVNGFEQFSPVINGFGELC